MTILVVGASGATGMTLVEQLVYMGHEVKVIVRSPQKLPESWKDKKKLSIIHASLLDIKEPQMAEYLKGCDAVASCLGHNMNWKGIYGEPRKLVTDAVTLLCRAIKKNAADKPIRFVLMSTTGNRNRDITEPISFSEKTLVGLIRLLLPPHVDNEGAADYLRKEIGQIDEFIEWVAVRPDSLLNEDLVSDYEVHPSPTRSALFNAGKTSRINVGHFMASLIGDDNLWNKWKGQMPVVYNKEIENELNTTLLVL